MPLRRSPTPSVASMCDALAAAEARADRLWQMLNDVLDYHDDLHIHNEALTVLEETRAQPHL
jgi:hypothetical protein